MKVAWDEEARIEFIEATVYYALIDESLGARLVTAVEDAVARILHDPNRFRLIEDGVRKLRLETFPYAVVYLVEIERIVIIAVMHLRRHPGYWRQRIR